MNGVLIRFWRTAVRSTRCAGAFFGSSRLDELMAVAAGLPQTTRRVLTLRKVYDFAPRDIAARLALTDAAVEHHLIAAARACGRQRVDDTEDIP
jgi:DNA-directed RNA polymerase specialized sigma24 family protein